MALPTIARDLHTDAAFSIWIVNGYQLAIMISLLPLAALGEIVGPRTVYLAGMALFTLASLACAFSHDARRTCRRARGAGIWRCRHHGVNTALLRFIYPHKLLGRGIGINALVVAVSAAVGPTIAAAILSVANWPWLFAVNVPIGIAALITGWSSLPQFAARQAPLRLSSALSARSLSAFLSAASMRSAMAKRFRCSWLKCVCDVRHRLSGW